MTSSSDLTDTARITRMPRRSFGDVHPLVRAVAPVGALRPIQVEALDCIARLPHPVGALLDLPVGAGKTGVSFLAALIVGAKRPLLLVPGDLIEKTRADLEEWYVRTPMLRGRAPTILAHHEVSIKKGAETFTRLCPDLVVIDEAHAFANEGSARTKRLIHYVAHNEDAVRVVGLSGTLLGRNVDDIAMLAMICCRDRSPLPLRPDALRTWAQVLNRGSVPDQPSLRALASLVSWADVKGAALVYNEVLPNGVRRDLPRGVPEARAAFAERWRTCPAIVSSTAPSCSASLYFKRWRPFVPPRTSAAMSDLSAKWVLPDGAELVDATEVAMHAQTLSWGFWHRTVWPSTVDPADVETWRAARRSWGGALRTFLEHYARPGLDSLALIQDAIVAGPDASTWGAVGAIAPRWQAWVEIRDAMPRPTKEAVWLEGAEDALRGAVASWIREHGRGLVWYRHRAVGAVLRDVLPTYGATDAPPTSDVAAAALSIPVFHKGHNLQAWNRNLLLELPNNADETQQLAGRTHRQGQREDEVYFDVASHTWALAKKIDGILEGAAVVRELSGPQKVLLGTWL